MRHPRGSDEFTRVLSFSDALFGIAMTLLVVAIGVPRLDDGGDPGELLSALWDLEPEITSFVISFAVIGRYWLAHHSFFARLDAVDSRLMGTNLVYLAFVAFLPFPTALLGEYFSNPVSVALYAPIVAAVSGLEVVMFVQATRSGLLAQAMPGDVFRWGVAASLLPVALFLASVPVAFVSTRLAVVVWLALIPAEMLLDRRRPPGTEQHFGSVSRQPR
jgi:uncharacterized membrane protein